MPRNWTDIAKFYMSIRGEHTQYNEALYAMYKLSRWISESPASEILYGHTSLATLAVFQKNMDWEERLRSQHLAIEPTIDGDVEFRFMDTMNSDKQWVRIASEDDIVDRLGGFIRQVGWAYHPVL